MTPFDPEDLQRFKNRSWKEVRAEKERYWAADTHRRGPRAGLAASEALWKHARAVDPSWPNPTQRAQDLAHHARVAAILSRLAHVFPRR